MLSISGLLMAGDLQLGKIASDMSELGVLFLTPFLMISAIWEHFTSMDYNSLLKKTLFAVVLSLVGTGVLKDGVKLSLDFSDSLINKYARESVILSAFNTESIKEELKPKKKLTDQEIDRLIIRKTGANSDTVSKSNKSPWEILSENSMGLINNTFSGFLFVLAYIAVWTIGQIYTLVYNLLLVFIPFLAALSIFPPTKSAAQGAVTSMMWCILCPILCTVVLCIIEQSNSFTTSGDGVPVLSTIQTMAQYLVMTVIIFYVPMITSAIISGKGVASVGDALGNAGATSALTMGKAAIMGRVMGAAGLGSSLVRSAIANGTSFAKPAFKGLAAAMAAAPTLGILKKSMNSSIASKKLPKNEPILFGDNLKNHNQQRTEQFLSKISSTTPTRGAGLSSNSFQLRPSDYESGTKLNQRNHRLPSSESGMKRSTMGRAIGINAGEPVSFTSSNRFWPGYTRGINQAPRGNNETNNWSHMPKFRQQPHRATMDNYRRRRMTTLRAPHKTLYTINKPENYFKRGV
jgi:hypothetical protein